MLLKNYFYLRTFFIFYTKGTHIKNKSNKIALTSQNKDPLYIGTELFNAGYKIM